MTNQLLRDLKFRFNIERQYSPTDERMEEIANGDWYTLQDGLMFGHLHIRVEVAKEKYDGFSMVAIWYEWFNDYQDHVNKLTIQTKTHPDCYMMLHDFRKMMADMHAIFHTWAMV